MSFASSAGHLSDGVMVAARDCLGARVRGKLILAPLTRGGNLPFRRLVHELGCDAMVGEMAYARFVSRRQQKELALLRPLPPAVTADASARACGRRVVQGVQLASKQIDETLRAVDVFMGEVEHASQVSFVDINCGCPIYEVAQKRGMGAALLRKPRKLERLLRGVVDGVHEAHGDALAVTCKIRTSPKGDDDVNVLEVARAVEQAGCEMLTIHGRTTNARYSRAADYSLIQTVADSVGIPVTGNGDILTQYEAAARMGRNTSVNALMTGRGALIKPWLFREVKDGKEWFPTALERLEIYYKLATYMKEHFGEDEMGKRRAWYFLPWHFNFFCRYQHLPEEAFGERSMDHPLMQTRLPTALAVGSGGECPPDSLLDRLFRVQDEGCHDAIADVLWTAADPGDAASRLDDLAKRNIIRWETADTAAGLDAQSGDRDAAAEGRG